MSPPKLQQPAVVVLNHPAWWDPLIGILLASHLWPDRDHYAPIDSSALGNYRFFEKLGFFGIEPNSIAGARRFLEFGEAITRHESSVLWITAQGTFVDPRRRPVELRSGVGHLVSRMETGLVIPLALEYAYWTERLPEVLIRFGEPIELSGMTQGRSAKQWTALVANRLQETQDTLSELSMQRDAESFRTIVAGRAGVGGIYDVWRRCRAWLRGETFRPEHGDEP